ncbi:glycoside hydrolase [Ceraceosorus guamensis]|uniref:Glycoside hydrolase n=1 Tax=Ceraceosorus guamensis TaxID=1522189 RepID=A0A316W3D1_9BASI|nr:glycoside hydrolase [Ceraceosorus guamensis]PWN43608.1 glycoside hydrolase [Ceraceosorus guamensis]
MPIAREVDNTALSQNLTSRAPAFRFNYGGPSQGADLIRGVSLGGWLVLEPFITPSLFDSTGPSNNGIIDEWTLWSRLGKSAGARLLQPHLNSFYTRQDLVDIKNAGFNWIRIPIGFWAFDVQGAEPYLQLNQYDLLKQAAGWAADIGLKVMVDVHGLPGSQNGFNHSGRQGKARWSNGTKNVERSLAIISTLSNEFSKDRYASSVVSIELVNEPVNVDDGVLKKYYRDGYKIVRDKGNLVVTLGDGFKGGDYWNGFLSSSDNGASGVSLDLHIYTVFDNTSIRRKAQARQDYYCSLGSKYEQLNKDKWLVVGEFSPAFTDCAKYLNGRGVGSRYDGSYPNSSKYGDCGPKRGPASGFSAGYKALLARFWQTQVDAYSRGSGYMAWTWKTEDGTAEEWSVKKGIQYGWVSFERALMGRGPPSLCPETRT